MSKDNSAHENTSKDETMSISDPLALSQALMSVYERAQPLFEEYFKNIGEDLTEKNYDPFNMQPVFTEYMEYMMNNPEKFWEVQTGLWQDYNTLWQDSMRRFMGEDVKPLVQPEKGDRRFKSKEWEENAAFDFIKQSYLLTCRRLDKSVRDAEIDDDYNKRKLAFHTKLFADALSPTNFAMTNPDVIKETMRTGGGNLINGLENLVDDLKRGNGELKISTTDYDAFTLGENIATTKGRVIYQNDLIQLIQYEPLTKKVFKTPLLIIPPWINKYYILDLRENNSYIKWCVEQGYTVFVISWANPDKQLAQKRFEDYMEEGVIASLDAIKSAIGEKQTNVIGYCLGGTLLTITLAYLKTKNQEERIKSATFLTTLIDFEEAGDLKLFMDDGQLQMMDKEMVERGYLDGKELQQTFSLLRSNDMIWSFVVNNYLLGKEPFPFDLLYWNDDSTNMPAAMHSFYLRKMYRDNLLCQKGGISMHDTPIDASTIKTPAYFLSAREDHIAPWQATYAGTQILSGEKTFTLSASGHVAGVVNHPDKNKYCYWSNEKTPKSPDTWLKGAKEHKGSWWLHWQKWINAYGGDEVPARKPKKGIEAAPGSYVKKQNT